MRYPAFVGLFRNIQAVPPQLLVNVQTFIDRFLACFVCRCLLTLKIFLSKLSGFLASNPFASTPFASNPFYFNPFYFKTSWFFLNIFTGCNSVYLWAVFICASSSLLWFSLVASTSLLGASVGPLCDADQSVHEQVVSYYGLASVPSEFWLWSCIAWCFDLGRYRASVNFDPLQRLWPRCLAVLNSISFGRLDFGNVCCFFCFLHSFRSQFILLCFGVFSRLDSVF